MTIEQLKTSYLFHLPEIRSEAQDLELSRDIREAERDHKIRGMPPLTRYEIHELVLRQDIELVIEETKLRAVGLSRVSVKDRLGPRVNERLGSTARDNNPSPAEHRGRLPKKRNCNRCNKRGHLAYACPDRAPPPSGSAPPTRGEMGEAKRSAPDTPDKDGKPSTRARNEPRNESIIPMHEELAGEEVLQTATVAVDEMLMTKNLKSDRIRLWELSVLTVAEKIIPTHSAGSSTRS